MRAEAAAAGRDPAALGYTRWGQIDMTADEVNARASQGVQCPTAELPARGLANRYPQDAAGSEHRPVVVPCRPSESVR